jgi:hypothetical protein
MHGNILIANPFQNRGLGFSVDYSLHNFISDFFIGNKQPDLDHCLLFLRIGISLGLRPPTLSSQGQVLYPNPKKANQYVLNIKHELTYVQGKTYTSLDDHAQTSLHLILCIAQPIFFEN